MSHETHHHHEPATETTKTPFRSAFFFVLILAGLFIAGVNFVKVMSHDAEAGHGGGHDKTETYNPENAADAIHHGGEAHEAAHPATADTVILHDTAPAAEGGHTEGH